MEIKIFENLQLGEIRTAGTSNEPMFCLADVCKVLDLQPSSTKNRLNKDGVSSIKVIDSLGREQQATFINEQNLGLEYGENVVSRYNVKETQPEYYSDRFSSLLSNLKQA